MKTIHVDLGTNSYPIYIERRIFSHIPEYLQEGYEGKHILIISDDHVFPLYGEELEKSLNTFSICSHLTLPHGEPTKDFQTLPQVYDALLDAHLNRSDLIIALGGGVIGDLAGFAAASYLRGIPFIQVPTSLLAQVDSSVGGKVAVDLARGKNLVGSFFHPKMVFIDPDVLYTLPKHFLRDGMGEVIKYGCIKDVSLFERLESLPSYETLLAQMPEIIANCIDIKRQVVEADQFDRGERMLLNFGHTLAHAIEQHFHYERESHGEAVAIGMYQITKIAEDKGLSCPGIAERIRTILKQYKLPIQSNLPLGELLGAIKLDKKNLGKNLNLILLREIGKSYIYQTDLAFFPESAHMI